MRATHYSPGLILGAVCDDQVRHPITCTEADVTCPACLGWIVAEDNRRLEVEARQAVAAGPGRPVAARCEYHPQVECPNPPAGLYAGVATYNARLGRAERYLCAEHVARVERAVGYTLRKVTPQ